MKQPVSPGHQFAAGILILPAFLFQDTLWIKAGLTVLFVVLSMISGKKFRFLPNLVILLSITAVHLPQPRGEILFQILRFRITLGALETGLEKGLTLIGMIYVSRFSVTRGLSFPGKLGILMGSIFYYFEIITEKWRTLPKKPVLQRLDTLLNFMENEGVPGHSGGSSVKKEYIRSPWAYGGLYFCVLGTWMLLFFV